MKNKFKVGQVVKFRSIYGNWVYERIFAIGHCDKHPGTNWIRVTDNGQTSDTDCGCLGEIKSGPFPLNKEECGR